MSGPYYSDDAVTLYHGDCREVLASREERSVDCVITDPPYDERTHRQAVGHRGGRRAVKLVDFESFTYEQQIEVFTRLGALTRRWVVATLVTSTAYRFDLQPPAGLRCLRVGVWVKTKPMPQLSADRPGMGWEPVVCLHRADVKPSWNGGGRAGVWIYPSDRQDHPASKPLRMVAEWVRLFTDPGDLILDPFAGSGTTLRAAKDEGRKAIGVEIDERYCELIAKRLSQESFDFEVTP